MRKLIVGAFSSIDGVMQAPGGPDEDPAGGFKYGGWVAPFWDDDLTEAMNALFATPFDLLLGRKTYDIFAAHWPYVPTDPQQNDFDQLNADIAKTFNTITKYVATHRPDSLSWRNSQGLGTDVVAAIRDIKAKDGPDLLTQGSTELLHMLFEAGLVDAINLLTFPVVLGKGKRLFGNDGVASAFRVTSSSTSKNGVVIARYEKSGEIAIGSFEFETPTDAELERRRTLT